MWFKNLILDWGTGTSLKWIDNIGEHREGRREKTQIPRPPYTHPHWKLISKPKPPNIWKMLMLREPTYQQLKHENYFCV